MIHKTMLIISTLTSYVILYFVYLLKYVWDNELRHEFCSFSKSLLSETQCIYYSNDLTFFTIFGSVAFVSLFLTALIVIGSDLYSRGQKITLAVFVGIQIIVAAGESQYCLGFLGCSTIEHFPYVLPFTLSFLFAFVAFTALGKKYNFALTISFIVSGAFFFSIFIDNLITRTLLKADYSFLRENYIEQVQDISVINENYQFEPTRQFVGSGPINRTAFQPALVLPTEYVEAAIFKVDEMQAPTHLYPVEGLPDSYNSNQDTYYIRERYVYIHQGDVLPATIKINGIKPGIIDIPMMYNSQTLSEIAGIPITSDTRLSFDITVEDNGQRRWNKIWYDVDGDGSIEMELSWKESLDYDEIWSTFMRTAITRSNAPATKKLEILNQLPSDWADVEAVNDFFEVISISSISDWSEISEVIAEKIINLQNHKRFKA